MRGKTHLACGVAAVFTAASVAAHAGGSPEPALWGGALFLAGCVAPDLDTPDSAVSHSLPWLHRGLALLGVRHRTLTHSLVGVAFCAAVCWALVATSPEALWLWPWFPAGCLFHVFLDALSDAGVPWLWPGGRSRSIRGRTVVPGHVGLYRVGALSEYVTAAAVCAVVVLSIPVWDLVLATMPVL